MSSGHTQKANKPVPDLVQKPEIQVFKKLRGKDKMEELPHAKAEVLVAAIGLALLLLSNPVIVRALAFVVRGTDDTTEPSGEELEHTRQAITNLKSSKLVVGSECVADHGRHNRQGGFFSFIVRDQHVEVAAAATGEARSICLVHLAIVCLHELAHLLGTIVHGPNHQTPPKLSNLRLRECGQSPYKSTTDPEGEAGWWTERQGLGGRVGLELRESSEYDVPEYEAANVARLIFMSETIQWNRISIKDVHLIEQNPQEYNFPFPSNGLVPKGDELKLVTRMSDGHATAGHYL